MATRSSSWRCVAATTTPIPPTPRTFSTRYLPASKSPTRRPILRDLFGEDEFLYAVNNDVADPFPRSEFPGGIRIPAVSHGLNDYRAITKIAFLSALNKVATSYLEMGIFP